MKPKKLAILKKGSEVRKYYFLQNVTNGPIKVEVSGSVDGDYTRLCHNKNQVMKEIGLLIFADGYETVTG